MQAPSARPVSARLRAEPPATREALSAEAHRLEAALDRFRAWRSQRAQEEAALIAQLTAHRKLTAQGVAKADQLSAKITSLRIQLMETKRPAE